MRTDGNESPIMHFVLRKHMNEQEEDVDFKVNSEWKEDKSRASRKGILKRKQEMELKRKKDAQENNG
jgi:hypothetical protein